MTKIKRFLAFIFDIAFIAFLVSTLYMLLGLIFKIDSEGYQNFMIFPLLIITISYLFFGEILFTNTLGKYLFGLEIADYESHDKPSLQSFIKRGILKIFFPVEGLILLFSKSQKRLGDIWAKTVVVNKDTNKLKPSARFLIGIVSLVALFFCFSISMGLAVTKTDFYSSGITYLKSSSVVKIVGLPKQVIQNRNNVNFIVPISNENHDKYAIIYLERIGSEWIVNHTDYTKEHIIGYSYSFNNSPSKQ